MKIDEGEFGARIRRYEKVLYLCHRNADPDAIGSAFALQEGFGGDLAAVEGINRAASSLIGAIGAEPIIDPSLEKYDLVVVMDTAVGLQIGNLDLGEYAVIDHHQDEGLLEKAAFYIQRQTDSTAEIVWNILMDNGIEASPKAALGLIVGIITDTGQFKHATLGSFATVAEILDKCDVEYDQALSVLSRVPADRSRRIAILKAMSRAEINWADDWIIVTTQVSAFEGSAAMTLVNIGADVAFVAGKHGKVTRISGRARRKAILAGVDLAKIMNYVGKHHDGDGGGHKGASALEAEGIPEILLKDCRDKVMEILRNG